MTRGRDVDRILVAIDQDCSALVVTLGRLADALEGGLGYPNPNELTPAQADVLATMLGGVGILGGIILERDLARTAAREAGA